MRLGAIALGAGALAVGYLWWRHSSSPTSVQTKPTTGSASDVASLSRGSASSSASAASAAGSGRPTALPEVPADAPLSGSAKTELALGFDDAHDQLRTLVAPCFKGKPPPKGKPITFRYRLLVAEKHATVEGPEIVSADFDLGAARSCMLTALDEASFATALPDLDTPIEDQLNPEEL